MNRSRIRLLTRTARGFFAGGVAAAVLLLVSPLYATTYTWVGANTGNWGDVAKWSPNTNYPGSGTDDIALFNNSSFFGGGGTLTLADSSGVDASFTIGSISKSSTSTNRNFSLSNVAAGTGKLIFSHSSGTATISVSTNSVAFTDNLNVGIQLNSNLSVSTGTNYTLRMTKAVSESGGSRSLSKSGAGTFVLRAANSYSGGTTVSAGTLMVDSAGTLGAGNVFVNGGVLDLQNAGGVISDAASLSISNGATTNLNTGITEWVGGLTLGGVAQTALGSYGSLSSSATFKSSFFTGTGVLMLPEPGSLGLLAIGPFMLLKRRRRAEFVE